MSSVLARYEVSGERRKPKPSGRISSVPSPKMLSPFFACCFSMAKIRSCLRIRLAPSSSLVLAISTSSVTGLDLSSDRCMGGARKGRERRRAAEGNTGRFRAREGFPGGRPNFQAAPWNLPRSRPGKTGARRGTKVSLTGSEVAVNKGSELGLRQRADLLRVRLAALEQDQCRNAPDAELAGRTWIGVDVELRDGQLPSVVAGQVLEHGRDHLAGTAPLGPVVD